MKSRPVAFCAMMAALSTAIMFTGGLVPVFTYCSPLIASFFLIPVLFEYGVGKAWMVWFITAVLSLLIGTDKEAAFFYIFFGWYPAFKPFADHIHGKALRMIIKTAIFSVCVAAMYGLTCFVFQIGDIIQSFSSSRWINMGFLAALVLIMLLYDTVLVRVAILYTKRLFPVLGRIFKKKR